MTLRLPVSFLDKALLNGRNIVETIIGHIKEFSSLRLPKHRSVANAFTHIIATVVAYQINPLAPKPIRRLSHEKPITRVRKVRAEPGPDVQETS